VLTELGGVGVAKALREKRSSGQLQQGEPPLKATKLFPVRRLSAQRTVKSQARRLQWVALETL
jgi:hypothetical protein